MATTKTKNVYKRSLINKYFNDEIYLKLYEVTLTSGVDNNERCDMQRAILSDYNIPFSPLGVGTNRWAALIDGYVVKFGMDVDGIN